MPLSSQALMLLQTLAQGHTLKSHRDIDGHKVYKLHTLAGDETIVAWDLVQALLEAGLIGTNQKFPAATFWLTEAGRKALQ